MDVIAQVKKDRGRFRLELGSGEVITVSGELYREQPFQPGDPIDVEAYDQWLLPRQYRPALERAVSLLALRAHARGELEQKLLRAGFRPQTVEMALYKLTREGLLDDGDFARQWAQARSERRLGPRRIARELRMKGVAAGDVEAALASLDGADQLEAAAALARKGFARAKAGEDPRKTAQRVSAMLARRGFDWDTVRAAVEQAAEE